MCNAQETFVPPRLGFSPKHLPATSGISEGGVGGVTLLFFKLWACGSEKGRKVQPPSLSTRDILSVTLAWRPVLDHIYGGCGLCEKEGTEYQWSGSLWHG